MTCREFLRLLDEDGPVETPSASDHVAACASCRKALERWRAVKSELSAMNADPLPPFLHNRLMAHIKTEREKRRRPIWGLAPLARWLAPLAVVGLVAVIVGHGVWRKPISHDQAPAPTPSPLRAALQAHRAAEPAEARESADTARADTARKNADTIVEPEQKPEQFSINGRPQAPDSVTLSFAPEVSEDRTHENADARLQKAAPEKSKQRLAESTTREEGEGSDAHRDTEEKLGALGFAENISEEAATTAPQPAPAARETPFPKLLRRGKGAARASNTVCLLTPVGSSEPLRSLELPADIAPPTGEVWVIAVLEDGRVGLADVKTIRIAEGRSRAAAEDDTLKLEQPSAEPGATSLGDRIVVSKDLSWNESFRDIPPGRYLLRRAPAER